MSRFGNLQSKAKFKKHYTYSLRRILNDVKTIRFELSEKKIELQRVEILINTLEALIKKVVKEP